MVKYRCKKCGAIVDGTILAKSNHIHKYHQGLCRKMKMHQIRILYFEPLLPLRVKTDIAPLPKQNTQKKKNKVNFKELLYKRRGTSIDEKRICSRCNEVSNGVWRYNVEGVSYYLCDKCHDKIKTSFFVKTKIIYTPVDTNRRKH